MSARSAVRDLSRPKPGTKGDERDRDAQSAPVPRSAWPRRALRRRQRRARRRAALTAPLKLRAPRRRRAKAQPRLARLAKASRGSRAPRTRCWQRRVAHNAGLLSGMPVACNDDATHAHGVTGRGAQVHIEAAFGTLRRQASVSDSLDYSSLERVRDLGKGMRPGALHRRSAPRATTDPAVRTFPPGRLVRRGGAVRLEGGRAAHRPGGGQDAAARGVVVAARHR
jgi:hypothetical protein